MGDPFLSEYETYSPLTRRLLSDCSLCPRNCHVNRLSGEKGFCGQSGKLTAARAALHMWEEPCISGTRGSGTVFFSGCNLRCVFCQNHNIAIGKSGRGISISHLADIFLSLQDKGANNINLVTPTHFVPQICKALELAKQKGLTLPVVYNTGSYEYADTLKLLDGLVDVWLPDFKYYSSQLSYAYSHAEDYFERACEAIEEMVRQTKETVFQTEADIKIPEADIKIPETDIKIPETGILKKGVIVRHLILPGQTKDSKKILRYLHETYGDKIYISIMNQYTPLSHVSGFPELNRKITGQEYDRVLNFALQIGIENGFFQEGETAGESFIPEFDGEGV